MHLAMQTAVQRLSSQLHVDTGGLESGATGMRHGCHMVHVTAFPHITMTTVICVLVCMK